jgi:hypothetical protein
MARGWESKSIEEQQSLEGSGQRDSAARLAAHKSGERIRARQDLELQRERILSQRTSSPARRAALEAALADIEARLTTLG